MAVSEQEIDRLFQLPLAEFTPARNALAKGAGPDAPAIKRLHRPHAAAWAVNQLYWRRRKTYERLVAASERLRATHGQLLSGKKVDLAGAEQAHRDAIKAALDEIRDLLKESGEKASPATMTAVLETLQALPRSESAGRLVRPLKPLGFEALSGLIGGAAASLRRAAEVVPFERRAQGRDDDARTPAREPTAADRKREQQARAREAEALKREAEARKREIAALQKQLTAAKAAERDAQTAANRARQAVQRASKAQERAEEALREANEELKRLASAAAQAEQALTDATGERARIEAALDQ